MKLSYTISLAFVAVAFSAPLELASTHAPLENQNRDPAPTCDLSVPILVSHLPYFMDL